MSSTSRKAGFTLVEILMILVIIAQLTAILLPVFSRVRDSARRMTCASNLKQIGLAITMYAADNDDYYPHKEVFPETHCAWADRVYPYLKNTAVFECPSTRTLAYIPGCPATDTVEVNEVGEYTQFDGGYDLNVLSYDFKQFPHEAAFTHSAETISSLDGGGRTIFSFSKDMTTPEGAESAALKRPRHLKGYNVLFLDGHTKWMKRESLYLSSLWKATD